MEKQIGISKTTIGDKTFPAFGDPTKLPARTLRQNVVSFQCVATPGAGNSFTQNSAFVFQVPYPCILTKMYAVGVSNEIGGLAKSLSSFQIRLGGVAGSIGPDNLFSLSPTLAAGCSVTRLLSYRSNQTYINVDNLNLYQSPNADIDIDIAAEPVTAFLATDSVFFNVQLYFNIL